MWMRPLLFLGALGILGLFCGSAAPFQANVAPVAGQPAGVAGNLNAEYVCIP